MALEKSKNVLFVTWDGPRASYLEGLFNPIFARLSERGYLFHILQFTWGRQETTEATRTACERLGIGYRAVKVWRRPKGIGAIISSLRGAWVVRAEIRRCRAEIVMPRSTMPAFAILMARLPPKVPMVFDADGLPLDERVEFAGYNPSGIIYRFLRDVESEVVRRANRVLVRSSKARDILLSRGGAGVSPEKFTVVGNGRDPSIFVAGDQKSRAMVRARIGIEADTPLLVYVGSVGPKYQFPAILKLLDSVRVRRSDARLLVITDSSKRAKAELHMRDEHARFVTFIEATPKEVPGYLACADLGISIIQQTFSMKAASPIKLGEYLLCGLPVVSTAGIGDLSSVPSSCGFSLSTPGQDELERAADWFAEVVLPDRDGFRARCREFGINHFSLDSCVDSYATALQTLGNSSG